MARYPVLVDGEQRWLFPSGSTMPTAAAIDSLVSRRPGAFVLYHADDDPDAPDTSPVERIDLEGSQPHERRLQLVPRSNGED